MWDDDDSRIVVPWTWFDSLACALLLASFGLLCWLIWTWRP